MLWSRSGSDRQRWTCQSSGGHEDQYVRSREKKFVLPDGTFGAHSVEQHGITASCKGAGRTDQPLGLRPDAGFSAPPPRGVRRRAEEMARDLPLVGTCSQCIPGPKSKNRASGAGLARMQRARKASAAIQAQQTPQRQHRRFGCGDALEHVSKTSGAAAEDACGTIEPDRVQSIRQQKMLASATAGDIAIAARRSRSNASPALAPLPRSTTSTEGYTSAIHSVRATGTARSGGSNATSPNSAASPAPPCSAASR